MLSAHLIHDDSSATASFSSNQCIDSWSSAGKCADRARQQNHTTESCTTSGQLTMCSADHMTSPHWLGFRAIRYTLQALTWWWHTWPGSFPPGRWHRRSCRPPQWWPSPPLAVRHRSHCSCCCGKASRCRAEGGWARPTGSRPGTPSLRWSSSTTTWKKTGVRINNKLSITNKTESCQMLFLSS